MTHLMYPTAARAIIDRIERTQGSAIEQAADLFADAIANDGLVHMFGSGHSRIGVEEIFPRIGSMVGYHPIVELSLSYFTNTVGTMGLRQALFLERVDGYGETILENYDFGPHDCMLVISSSGTNNVVVDIALGAKRRGLPLVGIVSVEHGRRATSRHPSGERLIDIADVVIDNCTPVGDAMIHVEGVEYPIGPGSTIGMAMVVHCVNERVAAKLVERGAPPVVLASPHVENSPDEKDRIRRNQDRYYAEVKRRLRGV